MTFAAILIMTGRIIFGLFFLIAGIRNFLGFAPRITQKTNYGWPLPIPMLVAGFALQLIGGVLLIVNVFTVYAAIGLIVFLVMATSLYHNLFMFQGSERRPHLYFTLVNITLAGGLLMVIGQSL